MEDHNAFEALFKGYYMQLFCFARNMVNDEEECRDIVGAAFEGVWKRLAEIDEKTVRAYLAAYYKAVTEDVMTDEGMAENDERTHVIRQVLDAMNPTTREILTACYVDGKKYREVAEDRGISISTVKKHMVAALRTIREARIKKA